MKTIKKARAQIEELIIEDETLKIYFLNKRKKSISVNKKEITIVTDEVKIIFNEKNSGKLIGIAEKNTLEEQDKWSGLVELLNPSSK